MIIFHALETITGAMINAISYNGSMTVSEMTAGGSRKTSEMNLSQIGNNVGSTAKIGIAIAMIATLRHGFMMTALSNNIKETALVKQWDVIPAPRAGITGIQIRAKGITSTLSNGMPNAMAARLTGPGMTAIKHGIRKTALNITTMGGYTASGSGM